MSFKKLLFLLMCSTLVCLLAFIAVIIFFAPTPGTRVPFILFYSTLWATCFGIATMGGVAVRYRYSADTLVFRDVQASVRQGVLFAILCTLVVFLRAHAMLSWYMAGMAVALITSIEITLVSFLAKK